MRKNQRKQLKKRFLSAALAMGMVLTMLPSDGVEAAAKRVVSTAAKGDVTYEYNNYTNLKTVVRERKAYKDSLTTGVITDSSKAKGSIENPMVLLEIVPYKDYSSIGYLVDGCEPINMDSLCGNKLAIESLTDADGDFFGFGKFTKPTGIVRFFPDEKEGDINFYQDTNLNSLSDASATIPYRESALRFTTDEWEAKKVTSGDDAWGYYEVVEKGTGHFILKTETAPNPEGVTVTTRSIEKADSTNQADAFLDWHTTNDYVKAQYRSEGFNTDRMYLYMANLNSAFDALKIDDPDVHPEYLGNRFYTLRPISSTDPCYDVSGDFYVYNSYDLFARNTLGLSEALAKKYSITVKTITPAELQANQSWLNIADVIYFNADLTAAKEVKNSSGTVTSKAALVDLWRSTDAVTKFYMNRFHYGNNLKDGTPDPVKGFRGTYSLDYVPRVGPSSNTTTRRDEDNYLNKSKELTLEVFYKILTRVTKAEDYVAVIFDQSCTDPAYNDTKANVNYYWYALGNKASERTRLAGSPYKTRGYKTNVAKLWLACTSANPGLVQRFMIDGEILDSGASRGDYEQLEVDARDVNGIIKYKANARQNISTDEREYWSGYTFYCAENNINTSYTVTQQTWDYWDDYAGDAKHEKDCYYVQGHVFVTPSGMNLVDYYAKNYSSSDLEFAKEYYYDFNDFLKTYGGAAPIDASVATSSLATKYVLDPDHVVNYYLNELKVLDIEPSVAMKKDGGQGNGAYAWKFGHKDVFKLIPKRMGSDTRVVVLEHQVMQAFVAKIEDLNSTYDLIYLGDDAGGLWNGNDVKKYIYNNGNYNGAKAGMDRTDFVDDSMDGLVYFHLGDTLRIANDYKKTAAFLGAGEDSSTRQAGNDLTTKKMKALVNYLEADYPVVVADNLYPGFTENLTRKYVDQSSACVMNKFLTQYDPIRHFNSATATFEGCYYNRKMLSNIDKMISNRMKGRVSITGPKTYDSINALDERYLPDSDGYAILDFVVDVPNTTDYMYRVFIDRNRDSNFTYDPTDDEKNEVITNGYVAITRLHNNIKVPMPDKWVGFVQWRIEVVQRTKVEKRYSLEGCSAVKAAEGAVAASNPDRAKKKIIALQIMPTHSTNRDGQDNSENGNDKSRSWVDLSNRALNGKQSGNGGSRTWQGLYNEVNDFDIEVVSITWRQFMLLFKPNGTEEKFSFDMGRDISITDDATSNPKQDVLQRVEQKLINFNDINDSTLRPVTSGQENNYYKLEDFNMIVLGFDDAFGFTDMQNTYGNVEYLYYFALKGCSILFTHDTTSQHSDKTQNPRDLGWKTLKDHRNDQWHENRVFGYTGNTMMREIMGMNRYMKFSVNLTNDTDQYVNFRSGLKQDIAEYVANNHIKYDDAYDSDTTTKGLHGFSLYNMLRYVGGDANDGKNGRVEWKYMVLRPSDNHVYSKGGAYTIGGNTLTEVVSRINEGQITQYPFTIGAGTGATRTTQFRIGKTHGQWWQLNMEDEDLTVWYTLDDPALSTLPHDGAYDSRGDNNTNAQEHNNLMYSAVPYDAANNFYIFSKGNIFYSGVGHSAVSSADNDQERKLFVNTLVAAYRPKFGLPFVQVTSSEATLTGISPNRVYSILFSIDPKYDAHTGKIDMANSEFMVGSTSEIIYNGNIYVKFRAMDNNGCTSIYTTAHTAATSNTADTSKPVAIYSSLDNAKAGNNSDLTKINTRGKQFYELTVGEEYYIKYPKAYVNDATNYRVIFESYNNRVSTGELSKTLVEFRAQPLFNLD